MSGADDEEIRRDADGDPIMTGISVTNGRFEHDELEERLIQEEL